LLKNKVTLGRKGFRNSKRGVGCEDGAYVSSETILGLRAHSSWPRRGQRRGGSSSQKQAGGGSTGRSVMYRGQETRLKCIGWFGEIDEPRPGC